MKKNIKLVDIDQISLGLDIFFLPDSDILYGGIKWPKSFPHTRAWYCKLGSEETQPSIFKSNVKHVQVQGLTSSEISSCKSWAR